MRRWLPACLFLMFATPSWSWTPRQGPQPNVRPSVDLGYSAPSRFRSFESGFGFGLGFEVEHAPWASTVFRVGVDWLTEERPDAHEDYYYDYYDRRSATILSWSIGGRGYLRSESHFRPYGEFDLGIRVGGGGNQEGNGLAITPRLGIAWTAFGGSGLSLDTGFSYVVSAPTRNGIVPIRLAMVFQ